MKIIVDIYDILAHGYSYKIECFTEKEAIECAQKFLESERTCKIVIKRIYDEHEEETNENH